MSCPEHSTQNTVQQQMLVLVLYFVLRLQVIVKWWQSVVSPSSMEFGSTLPNKVAIVCLRMYMHIIIKCPVDLLLVSLLFNVRLDIVLLWSVTLPITI